ncbi:MAG: ATP-binding protein [Burkholderiaceae bacterium]
MPAIQSTTTHRAGQTLSSRLWAPWIPIVVVVVAAAAMVFFATQVTLLNSSLGGLSALFAASLTTVIGIVMVLRSRSRTRIQGRRDPSLTSPPDLSSQPARFATGAEWFTDANRAIDAAKASHGSNFSHTTNAGGPDDLRQAEQRLQTIDTLTRCGYWEQDESGTYILVDPPNKNRHSPLLALQRTRRGELPDDWFEPESCHHLAALIARRQPFHDVIWSRKLPGGEILRLQESGLPRFGIDGQFLGYQGTIRELSEHSLSTSPTRLAINAMNASPLPAAIVHATPLGTNPLRQWSLQWANPAAIAATGHSLLTLQQLDVDQWLRPDESIPPEFKKRESTSRNGLLGQLDSEINLRFNGVISNRYGEQQRASITINKIEQTQFGTTTVIFVDPLTPETRRLLRESTELHVLRESDAKQALEIRVTARELESFSHTVSHDLRAPIRHITGFADMLSEKYSGVLDRVGIDTISRIRAAGTRMDGMLDALVELHQISATPVMADPLDLSSMFQSIASEITHDQDNDRIRIDIQPDLKCRADHMLMRMVCWNLLKNAVKFSSRSDLPQIKVSMQVINGVETFQVADNGVGFNQDAADGLFRPFARLHSSADYPGTGIGLATVQRIIRRHGGHIWAESTPGAGARFLFTLWD